MVDSTRRKQIALVLIAVVVLVFLLVIYITAIKTPGVYIDWNSAKPSKNKYTQVLTHNEVLEWRKKVVGLRKTKLESIYKKGELITIGNATYLASPMPKKMIGDNMNLWSHFSPLYEKIAKNIENHLKEPVAYLKYDYPLPGFHIFSGNGWLASGWHVASIHIDLQYKRLDWKGLDVDKERTHSFTLPLSLPPGAGLYFLDLHKGESRIHNSFRNTEKTRVDYELGTLYIHNGHQYHMISPYEPGEDRITLQGHAIYSRKLKKHILYW